MEDCIYCGRAMDTEGHAPTTTVFGIPLGSCPLIPHGWIVDPESLKRDYLWCLAVLLENRRLQLKYSTTASAS